MTIWINIKKNIPQLLQRVADKFSPLRFLFLFLLVSLLAALFVNEIIEQEEQARFDSASEGVVESIQRTFRIYEGMLNATRSFILTEQNLTKASYQQFLSGFDFQHRYPGVDGVGYVVRTRNPDEFVIRYFEPFHRRGRKSIGVNMYSDPLLRKAMEKARDTGEYSFSQKTLLGKGFLSNETSGFLLFLPIYNRALPISTVAERRKALQGFVYSPLPADVIFDFMIATLGGEGSKLQVKAYDISEEPTQEILFQSKINVGKFNPRYEKTILLPFFGWKLSLASTPAFESLAARNWVAIVFIFGVIVSCLIAVTLLMTRRLNEELQADLVRRQKSEESLRKAQKVAAEANQSKSRFLSSMSHEIRTPLGIIVGFTDLALEPNTSEDAMQKYLKTIKRTSQQLISLVGEILDLSKIESNHMILDITRFSLPQLLEEVVFSLGLRASEKNISLVWDRSHKIPEYIRTDITRFRQILINLINNALKFTSVGGVRITPMLLSLPEIGIPIELEILVSDTGIGIGEQYQKKLFQAYTQEAASTARTYGGTGLGLTLSKELAQLLGGDVSLQSSVVNQGSTFSIRIKAGAFEGYWNSQEEQQNSSAAIITAHKKSGAAPGPLSGVKVLLVEDSPDNQFLFKKYLEMAEARVGLASNGIEALQLLENEKFDVILMDIEMPELGGYDTLKIMKKRGLAVPVVALSAHAFQEERQKALAHGFRSYLSKPIRKAELVNEIVAVLNLPEGPDQEPKLDKTGRPLLDL